MVQFTNVLMALLVASATSAVPLQKRIAQTIADSTQLWVQACDKAGGGGKCNTISQTAFSTLLAAAGNCAQQDAADQMVDLAKTLHNNTDMIRLAQIFVQQPRNAPERLQVPYCQKAPKNKELNGFFHCQFAGSDFTKFSGDQTGNLPLGVKAVNPPGSCPALGKPVPDGVQLDTLVSSPGKPIGGSSNSSKVARDVPSNTNTITLTNDPDVSPDTPSLLDNTALPLNSTTTNTTTTTLGDLPDPLTDTTETDPCLSDDTTDPSDPASGTPYDTTSDLSTDSDPSQAQSPTDSFVPGSVFRRRAAQQETPAKDQEVKSKSKNGKDNGKDNGKGNGKGKAKNEKAKNEKAKDKKAKSKQSKAAKP